MAAIAGIPPPQQGIIPLMKQEQTVDEQRNKAENPS